MDYKTPLAKARGLGSAKSGTSHWWMQRVTAVVMIPLTIWVIIFLNLSINAPYLQTVLWLSKPFNSTSILVWALAVCYHAAIGLEVVIEDYVANKGLKLVLVWAEKFAFLFLAIMSFLAVIRIITSEG
jgi:succinate dehydrogenase / fumarate reductase membrane anchor subunit